jgi:hypothetical protein
METAVKDFIGQMKIGEYAAIIKFNKTRGATLVQLFTLADAAGKIDLIAAVDSPYSGSGTTLLDAVNLAIDHFVTSLIMLPPGPKAIIAVTDGGENDSTVTQSTVVANANDNRIPIFTVGVGDVGGTGGLALLTNLATQTGGDYFPAPDNATIADAYVAISRALDNDYLVTIPTAEVSDCAQHTLQVTVLGQTASVTFGRCDTTPDPFSFANKGGVAINSTITSDAATILGITGPAQIGVSAGEYSIGCGSANFRSTDSLINSGDTVCVRHTSSSAYSTTQVTTLTVSGVSGTFTSTTRAAPPPSGGGGGGATGVAELLLGLAALIARRRRRA